VQGTGTDFILTSGTSPSTTTVKAGQAANFTVWLGGLGAFSGTVSLSCTGGPQGSTCATAPGSVPLTLANPGTAVTVTISTTNQASPGVLDRRIFYGAPGTALRSSLALFAVSLFVMFLVIRRNLLHKIRAFNILLILLVLGLLVSATSCGGSGSPGSSPGPTSYTITVTGTSASITNSTNLTLIVNP
jgi:hypothetical protein